MSYETDVFVRDTGYIAHTNGYAIEDNPYVMYSEYDKYCSWRVGWFGADLDRMDAEED